jgi:DNA-binding transcriptional regulator YiaG
MDSNTLLMISLARKASTEGTGRALRLERRLGLREVAVALEVSAPSLSRWETGKRSPKSWRAVAYGHLLAEWMAAAEAEHG